MLKNMTHDCNVEAFVFIWNMGAIKNFAFNQFRDVFFLYRFHAGWRYLKSIKLVSKFQFAQSLQYLSFSCPNLKNATSWKVTAKSYNVISFGYST